MTRSQGKRNQVEFSNMIQTKRKANLMENLQMKRPKLVANNQISNMSAKADAIDSDVNINKMDVNMDDSNIIGMNQQSMEESKNSCKVSLNVLKTGYHTNTSQSESLRNLSINGLICSHCLLVIKSVQEESTVQCNGPCKRIFHEVCAENMRGK